jgi:hypothetical protein
VRCVRVCTCSHCSEWHLGDVMCKMTIWANGTMTGVSIFTLVAVTADRCVSGVRERAVIDSGTRPYVTR